MITYIGTKKLTMVTTLDSFLVTCITFVLLVVLLIVLSLLNTIAAANLFLIVIIPLIFLWFMIVDEYKELKIRYEKTLSTP